MEVMERAYVQSKVALSNYTQLKVSGPDTIDISPYSTAIAAIAMIPVTGLKGSRAKLLEPSQLLPPVLPCTQCRRQKLSDREAFCHAPA